MLQKKSRYNVSQLYHGSTVLWTLYFFWCKSQLSINSICGFYHQLLTVKDCERARLYNLNVDPYLLGFLQSFCQNTCTRIRVVGNYFLRAELYFDYIFFF